MNNAKILCASFLIISGCRQVEQSAAKTSNSWQTYSNELIQFEYPPAWDVQYMRSVDEHGWLLTAPGENAVSDGSVLFSMPFKKDKRSLEEIFRDAKWKPSAIIEKPKGLSVQGGKCIAYVTKTRSGTRAHADCLTHDSRQFRLHSTVGSVEQTQLAPGQVGSRLSDEARENLRRFERILKSLELKDAAPGGSPSQGG